MLSSNSTIKRMEIPYGTKTMNQVMPLSKNQNLSKRLLEETASHSMLTLDKQCGIDPRTSKEQEPSVSNDVLSAPVPSQRNIASHRHNHNIAQRNRLESLVQPWNDACLLQNTELPVSKNPTYRVQHETVRALSESLAERVNTLSASVEALQRAQLDHEQRFIAVATSLKAQFVDELKHHVELTQERLERNLTTLLNAAMTTHGAEEKKRLDHLETTLTHSLSETMRSLQQYLDTSLTCDDTWGSRRRPQHKNASVGTDMEQLLVDDGSSTAVAVVVDSTIDKLVPKPPSPRPNKRSHPDPKECNQNAPVRACSKRRISITQGVSSSEISECLEKSSVEEGISRKEKPSKQLQTDKAIQVTGIYPRAKGCLRELPKAVAGKPKTKSQHSHKKLDRRWFPKVGTRKAKVSLHIHKSKPTAAATTAATEIRRVITISPTLNQTAIMIPKCIDDADGWDLFSENPSFDESRGVETFDEEFEGTGREEKGGTMMRKVITRSMTKSPNSKLT
mmetsp:Transcript_8007/g.14240  ORF Transcript_8007/g.14240 Transcript_8007/m.14240 type:complete len:507 (+) Transcript_8007:288-1808(+)